MKKLLIIQLDEAYFLFETLQMLEKHRDVLNEFELSILVNPDSLKKIQESSSPLFPGLTSDISHTLKSTFDMSVNLSMNETSWTIHDEIQSTHKIGPYLHKQQLIVKDNWSSYLLTMKSKAPFLTFHFQDIYKNILGIKRIKQPERKKNHVKTVAFGLCNQSLFPTLEQEKLINLINKAHPHLSIKDVTEIDPVSDLSQVLYVGPASLEALKICEQGSRGIFLGSRFQGFNLLPYSEGHYFISGNGSALEAESLVQLISDEIQEKKPSYTSPYCLYRTVEENLFGTYLKSLNHSDENYPLYQSHVVLWNFILNLFDTNLEITNCSPKQVGVLTAQQEVLTKLIRLYDYGMSSIKTIHEQSASKVIDHDKIQGHMKNLGEIEKIADQIAQSHSFLRPVIDYYRIRRGQNEGEDFFEQSQHTFLMYSEEQQSFKVLQELIFVTLRKNEVSI